MEYTTGSSGPGRPGRAGTKPEEKGPIFSPDQLSKDELARLILDIDKEMKAAAKALEFEKAALLRDQIVELRQVQVERGILGK